MAIVLTTAHVRAIEDHARATYPEECCGFLIGEPGEPKRVREVRRATNVVAEDRARRYVIDPKELLGVDRGLAGSGRDLLGFYHSHPDHPARPSEFDLENAAWPGYSYVILSIVGRSPNDLRSWLLDRDGRRVETETLSITQE